MKSIKKCLFPAAGYGTRFLDLMKLLSAKKLKLGTTQ